MVATAEPVTEKEPDQRTERVAGAVRAVVRSEGVDIILEDVTPAYLANLLAAMSRP